MTTQPRADARLAVQAKLLRGLGDPTRLRLLELILDAERNVGDLVEATGVAQARISSHLACLRWCGLVAARQDGRRVYYRVVDDRVRALLDVSRDIVEDNEAEIFACERISDARPDDLRLQPPRRRS